ncbi:MAG: MerR family transcriptional regulator [Pseudomonadota bacterium]|nr:MerR family transcriptional regulator [Pseudomonadota bacterium]
MSRAVPAAADAGLPIAAVERETGLAKDTLRVWERRYGFPQPLRDGAGNRRYPAAQVERLKVIRRLLDAGQRPGKVVGLDSAALQALLSGQAPLTPAAAARLPAGSELPSLQAMLDAIAAHDPQTLRRALTHARLGMGLASFINELVVPLSKAVGEAWMRGRLEIFEEHLYTELVSGVLRDAIAGLAPAVESGRPRILLTTLPQEQHGLGLLMVAALLTLEGCSCISLGTQTPLGDIALAAAVHDADVVALSFTSVQSGTAVLESLRVLRIRLPGQTGLWVGGSCSALYHKPLAGITAVRSLSDLPGVVAQWHCEHPQH